MMNNPSLSRVWLEIDIKKIQYNFNCIAKTVAPAEVMVVLKANAYGLGTERLFQELYKHGVRRVGVAEIKEALPLLKKKYVHIYLLGSLLKKEVPTAVKYNLICPLTDLGMARSISRESLKQGKVTRCHFLIDTGMGRLGIPHFEAEEIIAKIRKLQGLQIEGIYSHFSDANDVKNPKTKDQIKIFKALVQSLNPPLPQVHMANSDGINNFPEAYFNMVRTGINLYGVFDLLGKHRYVLKPTLSLKTKLIAKRVLPKNYTIGYGSTYQLKQKTVVGTISAGYADGIPYTKLGNAPSAGVLIKGKFCKIIGRVSMDYVTVDLSPCPTARPGDVVVIFGQSGTQKISVEDLAKVKGSHPYNIICSLGNRVERVYLT